MDDYYVLMIQAAQLVDRIQKCPKRFNGAYINVPKELEQELAAWRKKFAMACATNHQLMDAWIESQE